MKAIDKFLQHELNLRLSEIRSKNPKYSLRAFAKKLNISPATLSLVLRGNNSLSKRNLNKIANKLGLESQITKILSQRVSRKKAKPITSSLIKKSQGVLLEDSKALCLLNLMKTQNFKLDINWIAKRIDLSETQTTLLIEKLLEAELLTGSKTDFRRSKEHIKTSDGISDTTIQNYHIQQLKLAIQKITSTPINIRDYQNLIFPVSIEKIPQTKELISDFLEKVSQLSLKSPKGTEVFSLSLQLYPLTKIENKTDAPV